MSLGAGCWTGWWKNDAHEETCETGTLTLYRDGVSLVEAVNPGFRDLSNSIYSWRVGNQAASTYASAPGYYDNFRVSAIPEPGALGLILLGLGALRFRRRHRG